MPRIGAYISVLYMVLVFLSPADVFPVLGVYRPMLVLTVIAMLGTLFSITSNQSKLKTPEVPLIVLLFAWIAISHPLHGWPGGFFVAIQEFAPSFVMFLLILLNMNKLQDLRLTTNALVGVTLYNTIRGIMAFHFGWSFDEFTLLQRVDGGGTGAVFDHYRVRALGIFADPNDFAQIILLNLPFLFLAWKRRSPLRALFLIGIASVFLYGLYLTGSRGALVGLCVLLAFVLKAKLGFAGPVLSVLFTIGLFLVTGFGGGRVLSVSSGTGGGRLELWSEALGFFMQDPIRGVGYNSITEFMRLTAHNSFLLAATELGLPGYFFWLGLIVTIVVHVNQVIDLVGDKPDLKPYRRIARAILLAIYSFLATGWFLSRSYILSLYIVLGLGAAAYLVLREKLQEQGTIVPGIPWFRYTIYAMGGTLLAIYLMVRVRWAS